MKQKFPIKTICVVVLILFILWLWRTSSGDDAVVASSVGVLSDTQETSVKGEDRRGERKGLLSANNQLGHELADRLNEAVALIERNEIDSAVVELNAIIDAQPEAVEPYINLAALYAKMNDVERARDTLLAGIKINENTATLFDSLQSIYAAQASQAYQRALEADGAKVQQPLIVELPVIRTLSLNQSSVLEAGLQQENQKLRQRLLVLADEHQEKSSQLQAKINDSEKERSNLRARIDELSNSPKVPEINIGEPNVDELNKKLLGLQRDNTGLREELAKSERQRTELETRMAEQVKSLETQLLAIKQSQVDAPVVSVAVEPSSSLESNEQVAQRLVKSWAREWANQNVAGYIARYTDTFKPNNGLTHKQWREQRRVRLTNKSFIEVDVSNFKVKDLGERFSVTFTQHYRSNNVDDRITKQLLFVKKLDDWSDAKIIAERVVN